MDELIKQAEKLQSMIKAKDIDNPVLKTSMLSELEFFIENIEKGDE